MGLPFIKEAVTSLFQKSSCEMYPAVPKEAPEGYRGRIVFHGDLCIGCGMCERVCAGGAISTHPVEENEDGTVFERRFFLGSCTFCSNCADFCSKHAIELSGDYHMVARSEDDLVVTGTYLKKKPKPKPAAPAAAAPAASSCSVAPRGDGKPVSDPEKCVYCGLCARKCPAEAITVDRASKTWKLDGDKCLACGNCAAVCPKKCVVI